MSNYPTPTADSAISGLTPITTPLTVHDLLIISIKLNDAYYTGKITLEQIRRFFLDNTIALEISGLIGLLDGKSNTGHSHSTSDILNMNELMATKANLNHTHTTAQVTGLATLLEAKANLIHTHDINSISGLVSALASKAGVAHGHEITDIIGLKPILDSFEDWTSNNGSNHEHQMSQIIGLDDRFAGKANTSHNHLMADISGLVNALADKSDVGHTHTAADFENIGPLLETKSNVGHTHNLVEIGGLELALGEKAARVHRHALDDVDGLRNELNDKAPSLHNHGIASIDGLDLELNNKSNLDHTHLMVQIEGLDEALLEKAKLTHVHTPADVVGLEALLESKAEDVHTHSIESVTGLRTALNEAEAKDNKVQNLDTRSEDQYPSVNAVLDGVDTILTNYNFPVNSVNGLTGSVTIGKNDVGLSNVDNTSDMDKPISDAMRLGLSSKVDRVITNFDSEATPGRVVTGDEYITAIQKLQWQIDVMRGLLVEPLENALQIIPEGYTLKFIFEKEVKFRNNLLNDNNFNVSTLFDEIVLLRADDDFNLTLTTSLIEIQSEDNVLTITLKPNWITPESLARLDSIDQGGEGTGIINFETLLNFRNMVSVDGSLVNPLESTIDLTVHTNLSERGLVHDDVVYERAVVLGTWAAVPFYGFIPEPTMFDFFLDGRTLRLSFTRDILVDGVPLKDYEGTGAELLTSLFEPSVELDLIIAGLKESQVSMETTADSLNLQLKPGFVDGAVLAELDQDDNDGIHRLDLVIKADMFTSIDGEEIVFSRSPSTELLVYAHNTINNDLFTEELYDQAIVISTWGGEFSYVDVPTPPVTDLMGVLVTTADPVNDLTGAYVDE